MGKVDCVHIPLFADDGPKCEADFCAWLEEQGRRLRTLRIPGVDTDNIAEEIEGLARADKRQIVKRLSLLLAHLLTSQQQPEPSEQDRRAAIGRQREAIEDLLHESPSLRPSMPQFIERAYPKAVLKAATETGLAGTAFPASCEWTAEDLLRADFFPGPAA